MAEREHDIVLFGATGFTGALTAEYLAAHAGDGLRWALAGRNRAKLEALAERLGVDVPLLHADVNEDASLRDVADAARVVITTVGPYVTYGEPLVAACASAGTDLATPCAEKITGLVVSGTSESSSTKIAPLALSESTT